MMVWAAGNDSDDQVSIRSGLPYHYPGLRQNWLTVVAADNNLREPRYTNRCGVAQAWCITAPGGGDDQYSGGIYAAIQFFVISIRVNPAHPWRRRLYPVLLRYYWNSFRG